LTHSKYRQSNKQCSTETIGICNKFIRFYSRRYRCAYHWIELNNLAKEFKKTGYIIVLTLSNYEQKSHCRDFVLLKALTKNIDAEVLVFFSHDCPYRLILLLTFQALNRL